MSYLKIDTGLNEVLLRKCYDVEDCVTFYDVYEMPDSEEELTGMYLGEFTSKYEFEDEREFFFQELDEWLKNN